MVWEENHARGLSIEQMCHPKFREQAATVIDEMINWHYNHPSILLWGILNECESATPEGRRLYAEQFRQVRRLDRSRPVTFASCRHHTDICQGLPDICGWNWYFGWYSSKDVKSGVRDELKFLHSTPARNKPIIVSEFGAGAIPGFYDPIRRAKWSEDRQCDILAENLREYLTNPRFSGAFVWQFCDVRVDEAWSNTRPRCINDKGIVDGNRRKKLAYQTVKKFFHRYRT